MKRKLRQRANRHVRTMECLEDRCLMTGNVNVWVDPLNPSTLQIRGDVQDNQVVITQAANGSISVSPAAVAAPDLTTVNGSRTAPQPFVGITRINAVLGNGNDTIEIRNGGFEHVFIDTVKGDDKVLTGSGDRANGNKLFAARNMEIRTREGDDTVRLRNGAVDYLHANLGAGDDSMGAFCFTFNSPRQATIDGDSGTNTLDGDNHVPFPQRWRINGVVGIPNLPNFVR